MLASLFQNISPIGQSIKASHILVVLPKLEKISKKFDSTGEKPLEKLLLRREMQLTDLSETPVSENHEKGKL